MDRKVHHYVNRVNLKCSFLILIAVLCLGIKANAQTDETVALETQVQEVLNSNLQFSVFKDSVAIYGFAFKLELNNVNGKAVVTDIDVNDSVATKIYPDYRLLKGIDYSVILQGKAKATLILPVCLILRGMHSYKEQLVVPIGDIPNNIIKIFNMDKRAKTTLTNYIYLSPMVLMLDNSVYN